MVSLHEGEEEEPNGKYRNNEAQRPHTHQNSNTVEFVVVA